MTRIVAALAASLVVLSLPAVAQAKTFTVNSTADTADAANDNECRTAANVCTIRAAVTAAFQLSGADRIVIPGGTYQLGSSLTIQSTVDIEGPDGARSTILDGTASQRVINVNAAGSIRFSGITLTGGNGGIFLQASDLTLDRVAIRGNTALGPGLTEGGGVFVFSGSLTITRSTLSGNTARSTGAQALGGAVSLGSNTALNITNSTIAGNTAQGDQSSSFGGGLSLRETTITVLRHVTLVGNAATGGSSRQGGNLSVENASVTIGDSIIADGSAITGPNCNRVGTTIATNGRNLDSGTTCGFAASHLNSTPANLEPLADRGGPTDTRAPMPASAVRDAAGFCEPDGTDQRGAPLPTGSACDIGSTELGADLVTTLTASNPSVRPGENITFIARVRNDGLDSAPATVLDFALADGAELVLTEPSVGTCNGTHCDIGTLASGASATVTLVLRAPSSGQFSTSAAASSSYPDPDAGNNSATVTTTVDENAPPSEDPPPSDGDPPPTDGDPPPTASDACMNRILGTRRANTIRGTAAGDFILGKRGADTILGRRGADCLFGNAGNDTLKGGGGKDELNGGRGKDKLNGGGRKDKFSAGAGNDNVNSADGVRETVKCGRGNDTVKADRNDRLRGCERVTRV
ncbi:MAG: choice-of-anchor Q domain-containing protein [Thermoleophilaceae bacterium]